MTALFMLLFAMLANGQERKESFDITRKGYTKLIVNGTDTLEANYLRFDTAVKGADDYADTVNVSFIDIVPFSYRYVPSYAPITRDTVFLSDVPFPLRNISHVYVEDSAFEGFKIQIIGNTTAQTIRYASKCIGYDSTMTAVDQRISMELIPDSLGNVNSTTPAYTCLEQNAMMTYWLTAYTDSLEYFHRVNLDVAHDLSIGN